LRENAQASVHVSFREAKIARNSTAGGAIVVPPMVRLLARPQAVVLTLVAALAGCAAPPALPRSPTSEPATAPGPRASSGPIPSFDGEAITKAFAMEKLQTSIVDDDHEFVRSLAFRGPGSRLPPLEHVRSWLAAHGALLGYGTLGPMEPEPSEAERPQDLPSDVVRFPNAERCPGLRLEVWYQQEKEAYVPYWWHFECGSSVVEEQRIKDYQRLAEKERKQIAWQRDVRRRQESKVEERKVEERKPQDRIADWARSEGLSPREVKRRHDGVRVALDAKGPNAANGATRRAYTEALAARAAQFEGLPALDTTEVTQPYDQGASDPKLLSTRFLRLERRLARPPLDGACIDPRVRVDLWEESAPSTQKEAAYWVSAVTVTCEKENPGGKKAPPHAAPRSSASSAPFLAICGAVNYAVDAIYAGTVIDNRGDVYTFRGGKLFSGSSAHELAVLLRHEKAYAGTLPPEEVDRLVALTPTVAREPLKVNEVMVPDAPGAGCSLLMRGATPDALVSIPFDHSGANEEGTRSGPASRAAQAILGRADKLANP
jgi:hypothetical protein